MRVMFASAICAVLMVAPAMAATCLLEVDGETYIDGPCEFSTWGSADFQVLAGDYFAYVYPSHEPPDGYWNEAPEMMKADTPLGELKRDGACWVNDTVKVCAYR